MACRAAGSRLEMGKSVRPCTPVGGVKQVLASCGLTLNLLCQPQVGDNVHTTYDHVLTPLALDHCF